MDLYIGAALKNRDSDFPLDGYSWYIVNVLHNVVYCILHSTFMYIVNHVLEPTWTFIEG